MRFVPPAALCLLGALGAQTQDFGKAYSFAEREPRTRVEQVIDKLLPSIVKIHGASGLATISAYASGIIVTKQGHILTLDQIMIQKDRTRVVLYDGSVHQATLLPEDPQLGVRLLKIDPALVQGELQPLWPPAAAIWCGSRCISSCITRKLPTKSGLQPSWPRSTNRVFRS